MLVVGETNNQSTMDREVATGGLLDSQHETAWRSYFLGSMMLTRLIDRELKEHHDMTSDDFAMLVLLSEAPGHRMRFGELAALTRFPKAHITYRFQRLADRGLLEREDCETDARGAYAAITERGIEMVEVVRATHDASVNAHFFSHLSDAQVDAVGDAMSRVLDAHDGSAFTS